MPLRTDVSHYSFEIELDSRLFGFEFRWNTRDAAWFINVFDGDGVLLRAGIKVVLGLPLMARAVSPDFPSGELLAVDTTDSGVEAGLSDLGARVQLLYVEAADLP